MSFDKIGYQLTIFPWQLSTADDANWRCHPSGCTVASGIVGVVVVGGGDICNRS